MAHALNEAYLDSKLCVTTKRAQCQAKHWCKNRHLSSFITNTVCTLCCCSWWRERSPEAVSSSLRNYCATDRHIGEQNIALCVCVYVFCMCFSALIFSLCSQPSYDFLRRELEFRYSWLIFTYVKQSDSRTILAVTDDASIWRWDAKS